MSDIRPRVRVPRVAPMGGTVRIQTMATHAMENGNRRDLDGEIIPRFIINRFTCAFNGETVADMEIGPSVAANPFIEFEATVPESGVFTFTWVEDDGTTHSATAEIEAT